jgi:hypothetical protein
LFALLGVIPEMYVIPKGKEHKPFAASLCQLLLTEPRGVVNTEYWRGLGTAGENRVVEGH